MAATFIFEKFVTDLGKKEANNLFSHVVKDSFFFFFISTAPAVIIRMNVKFFRMPTKSTVTLNNLNSAKYDHLVNGEYVQFLSKLSEASNPLRILLLSP